MPTDIKVDLDIRPNSCPNSLNTRERGVLPVAILGTASFDVTDINVSTVKLEGVAPLRSSRQDVAAPFSGDISDPPKRDDCTTDGPDGFVDLVLHFDAQAVVAALEASGPLTDSQVVVVTLTGESNGGTPIHGEDVVWIVKK